MQSVTSELAERIGLRLQQIPAHHHPAVATLLDAALEFIDDVQRGGAAIEHLYVCRACERDGRDERFEELAELIVHRRAHAVAEEVAVEERRPVMAAVIRLASRRRFGRAVSRLATSDMPEVSTEICP